MALLLMVPCSVLGMAVSQSFVVLNLKEFTIYWVGDERNKTRGGDMQLGSS